MNVYKARTISTQSDLDSVLNEGDTMVYIHADGQHFTAELGAKQRVYIGGDGMLSAHGEGVVIAGGRAVVYAYGAVYVLAYSRAHVRAYNDTTVFTQDYATMTRI